jgi:hypothetical protein
MHLSLYTSTGIGSPCERSRFNSIDSLLNEASLDSEGIYLSIYLSMNLFNIFLLLIIYLSISLLIIEKESLIIACYHLPVVVSRNEDSMCPFTITWADSLIGIYISIDLCIYLSILSIDLCIY